MLSVKGNWYRFAKFSRTFVNDFLGVVHISLQLHTSRTWYRATAIRIKRLHSMIDYQQCLESPFLVDGFPTYTCEIINELAWLILQQHSARDSIVPCFINPLKTALTKLQSFQDFAACKVDIGAAFDLSRLISKNLKFIKFGKALLVLERARF